MHLCRVAAVGHHLYFFYCLGDVGEATRWYFFRWRVIGLGLWVQIGTADGGKCFAVDAALSMVGVVLGGGCKSLDTRRTPFPLLVADGLQWKGEKGQTDCTSVKLQDPEMGLSSGCFVGLELIEGES